MEPNDHWCLMGQVTIRSKFSFDSNLRPHYHSTTDATHMLSHRMLSVRWKRVWSWWDFRDPRTRAVIDWLVVGRWKRFSSSRPRVEEACWNPQNQLLPSSARFWYSANCALPVLHEISPSSSSSWMWAHYLTDTRRPPRLARRMRRRLHQVTVEPAAEVCLPWE